MNETPNSGVYYEFDLRKIPAFIPSSGVRHVLRAAAHRETQLRKLAGWLAVFGFTLD